MSSSSFDINSNNLNNVNAKVNGKPGYSQSPSSNPKLNNGSMATNGANAVISQNILEDTFYAATKMIQNLPKNGSFQLSNEMLLKFYGYYKQATDGPCNRSKPSMFKVVEKAKWDAWNSVKNLSKDEAMNAYVQEIKNIVETMPHSEYVEKFLEILGPFYEYVEDDELSGSEEEHEEQQAVNQTVQAVEVVEKIVEVDVKLNGNGQSNGHTDNGVELDDDDTNEHYCDTSDSIENHITLQTIKLLKLNNMNGDRVDETTATTATNGFNHGHGHDEQSNYEDNQLAVSHNPFLHQEQYHREDHNLRNSIINYGGESNANRSSRPNSTHSNAAPRQHTANTSGNVYNVNNGGFGNAGSGGSGAGGGDLPPHDGGQYLNINYLQQDTSRQIILLLARLQQDTSNVLTRLSYLEATVMSIQNGLQLNRLESTLHANEQKKNALEAVGSTTTTTTRVTTPNRIVYDVDGQQQFSFLYYITRKLVNVDWKTVGVALIAPLVIRLAFYFIKKFRLLL